MDKLYSFEKKLNGKNEIMKNIEEIYGKITKYNKETHGKGGYGDSFVYFHKKDTNDIFVINGSNIKDFDNISEILGYEFKVICYDRKSGILYKSFIPIEKSKKIIRDPLIPNIIENILKVY